MGEPNHIKDSNTELTAVWTWPYNRSQKCLFYAWIQWQIRSLN